MFKVKIEARSKTYLNNLQAKLRNAVKRAFSRSLYSTTSSIKDFVPVVTGNLQRSINFKFEHGIDEIYEGNSVKMSFYSDLYYAKIIDEGLQGYKRRDYLKRGVSKELPHIINRIENSITEEFNK